MQKPRALRPGDRLAVVSPASPFNRDEFDLGIEEIRRLGFEPVFDDTVFARQRYVSGSARASRGRDSNGLARSVDCRPDRRSRRLRQRASPAAARSRRGPARLQAVHRLQRPHLDPHVSDARLRSGRLSRTDAGPAAVARRRGLRRRFIHACALPPRADGGTGRRQGSNPSATAKPPASCSAAR